MLGSWLAAFDRRFLPEGVGEAPERLRVRSVAGLGLSLAALCAFSLVLHVGNGDLYYAAFAVVGIVLGAALPQLIRRGRTDVAAALMSGALLVFLTAAAVRDGGLRSPAIPWLILVPTVTYAIAGPRQGWVSTVALGSVFTALWALDDVIAQLDIHRPHALQHWFMFQTALSSAIAGIALFALRERALVRALAAKAETERARAAAEIESRAKSAFLASVSHEIRTPLNGVLGTAEILQDAALGPEQREHVEVIRSSGEILLTILNDVLDSAKADANELVLVDEAVEPRRLVESVVRLFAARARGTGMSLRHEVETSLPDALLIDPQRLRQILLNLVGNAVKFTEAGEVVVRQAVQEGRWIIEVRDTGPGIPADRLDAIFEPFVQATADTARRYGGTGLGLSICRRLVRLMDGALTVQSTLGQGSRFVVDLPARPTAPTSRLSVDVLAPDPAGPLDVLVAEDNRVNQRVIQRLLEREGHRVFVVADGAAAVASCAARHFDLVLMDVQMPTMDGLMATRALREDPTHAGLRIVALSASAFAEDRRQAIDAGMDDFLSKPLVIDELRRVLGATPTGHDSNAA